MSNKINFLFRCNTLTSFERTSSSCVHCSNGQNEPRSSGGSDNSKWLLLGSACRSRRYRSFGRWYTKVPKIPGSVARRIFPPKFSSGASRLPRGFRLGAERGEGAVATHYPPQSAPTPTTMCQGSMDPNKVFNS